jgi:hypothetical protein
MTTDRPPQDELRDLLWSMEEGSISAGGVDRIDELVRGDEKLLRHYIEHVRLVSDLRFGLTNRRVQDVMARLFDLDREIFVAPPIILDLSPVRRAPLFTLHSPVGGFLFSYLTATLILGIGLLVGWTWKISHDRQAVLGPARQETPLAGRITGIVDCRWADPKTEAFDRDDVPLGRRYALASGFIEITYDTGAKVILQGPCTFEVESKTGGFLSLGKLTARGEGRDSSVEREGRRQAADSGVRNHSPVSTLDARPATLDSSLFSVRTPAALVTDLGTEFGVEVDGSGATRSHVFRGKIELRWAGSGSPRVIQLGANESARVEVGRDRAVRVLREPVPPSTFARQMPKPNPFKLFNTGVGAKEGDPDPHWQVVARSDDPNFKPRPAVVTAVGPNYLANDPAEAQWISLSDGPPELPNGVTCIFRTTFEVRGAKLTDPMPDLAGRFGFGANTRVKAIRVNGKNVYAPKDAGGLRAQISVPPAGKRWVEGVNYVELDVTNDDPLRRAGTSPIFLRVVWH